MIETKVDKLNREYELVIDSIVNGSKEFEEIRSFANDELIKVEDRFLKLKIEVNLAYTRIEDLKNRIEFGKSKAYAMVKDEKEYLEIDVEAVKKEIERNSFSLIKEENKICKMIKKQEKLTIDIDSLSNLSALSSKKIEDMKLIYNVLQGNKREDMEETERKANLESWGIQVLEAQELERKRIAREMHDGPTQNLSNLLLKTELCIRLFDKDINRTKLELNSLKLLIRSIIEETRRLISNLRPMIIDDLGLMPTLERLIDDVKTEYNVEILVKFEECKNIEFDPVFGLAIYRISQEALNNIKRHSKATKIMFEMKVENETLTLTIVDNGIGFKLNDFKENKEENRGFGISMMRERTDLLNGKFQIASQIELGTTINIQLPLNIIRKAQKDE